MSAPAQEWPSPAPALASSVLTGDLEKLVLASPGHMCTPRPAPAPCTTATPPSLHPCDRPVTGVRTGGLHRVDRVLQGTCDGEGAGGAGSKAVTGEISYHPHPACCCCLATWTLSLSRSLDAVSVRYLQQHLHMTLLTAQTSCSKDTCIHRCINDR